MVDKLPFLSDEHHYAITAVATRSAQLDHSLEYAIMAMLGPNQKTADFLLHNLSQERLVEFLQALLSDHFPDDGTKIKTLIERIKTSRTARNEVLHWVWGKSSEEGKALAVSLRPHREHKTKFMTAPEIEAIAANLFTSALELPEWSDRYYREKLGLSTGIFEPPSPPPGSASPSGPHLPGTPGPLDPPQRPFEES